MPKSRRSRVATRREFRVAVRFSAAELAAVEGAAGRSGQALAAWLGQVAIDAADLNDLPAGRAQRETLAELVRLAGLIRQAGTLLNRAIARPRSTGAPGPDLGLAVAYTMKILARVDDATTAAGKTR
ncbi:MAG: hypothetical protein ACRDNZ_12705 [Streptosporangiaceae bacterium]